MIANQMNNVGKMINRNRIGNQNTTGTITATTENNANFK